MTYFQVEILQNRNPRPGWIAEDNILETDPPDHLLRLPAHLTAAINTGNPLDDPENLGRSTSRRGERLQVRRCAGGSEASQQNTEEDCEEGACMKQGYMPFFFKNGHMLPTGQNYVRLGDILPQGHFAPLTFCPKDILPQDILPQLS